MILLLVLVHEYSLPEMERFLQKKQNNVYSK